MVWHCNVKRLYSVDDRRKCTSSFHCFWLTCTVCEACILFSWPAVCLFLWPQMNTDWNTTESDCFIRFWFEGPQACQRVCFFVCVLFFIFFCFFKFWYEVFVFGDLFYFVELFRNAVSYWFIWVLSHLFSRVDETFHEIISDVRCIFQCVYLGMSECCFMYVCVISIPLNFMI